MPSEFDRAVNVDMAADELLMMKAMDNVLEHAELRPLPVLEGPVPIPKNTPLMNPTQQAVMLPPFPFQ